MQEAVFEVCAKPQPQPLFSEPSPVEDMQEAVFEVCAKGDTLKFERLVEEDKSVLTLAIGRSRDTPLHFACKSKQKELASLILGLQPAVAKAKNEREETPLHEASRVGELEIVKQLLDASPCVAYMLNRDKESALFIACSCGHSEVASELCSRMDFLGWVEIGASCLQIAASKGYTEIVRKLLEANPSLASRKDEKGFSALHLASSKGNLGSINEFLGKDPNLSFLRDNDGRTPLHLAMLYNQVHVVTEFLLERPTPASFNSLLVTDLINTADNNGDMVLHLAAKGNCLEIIELLLSKPGIKLNAANNEGNTALDILEQIPVRGDNANVAVETLGQIPARDNDEYVTVDVDNDSWGRRMAIIQQLKARKRANPPSLIDIQMTLIAVAALIVAITYQAILSPPGGLWQDSDRGNHDKNHKPGKAILVETNPGLYKFFMAFNSLGFLASVILIIMNLPMEKLWYEYSPVVVALVSITVAFIISSIMIS